MSTTSDIVEQAIAKEEADAASNDTSNGSDHDNDKKTDNATDSKPAATDDTSKPGDTDASKSDSEPAEDEAEGEYTADDALETDAPATDTKPAAPTDNAGIQLSPAEQKYVVENIGEPLVLQGYKLDADGNRQPYEIKAYAPENIPDDFNFTNEASRTQAVSAFNRLDTKANELLGNYRTQQSNEVAADYERRENEGIRSDVADLQKEGRFPKFKVQPGANGFDDTAEAKQMAEVLAIMSERNDIYMKQYNQGRPYKHIGFSEAYEIYERTNPDRQAAKQKDADQAKEDAERKTTAERGDSNRGSSTSNIVKPTVRAGTTTRDILARIEAEE